jgi:hypothetical protein
LRLCLAVTKFAAVASAISRPVPACVSLQQGVLARDLA